MRNNKLNILPLLHFKSLKGSSLNNIFYKNLVSQEDILSLSPENKVWLAYFLNTYPKEWGREFWIPPKIDIHISDVFSKILNSDESSNIEYVDILSQILEEVDMDDNQQHILENLIEKLNKEFVKSELARQEFENALLAANSASSSNNIEGYYSIED